MTKSSKRTTLTLLQQNTSMNNSAKDIYNDLIKRIKDKVNKETSIVYDPATGIQKCFLRGKLLWVKKVNKY